MAPGGERRGEGDVDADALDEVEDEVVGAAGAAAGHEEVGEDGDDALEVLVDALDEFVDDDVGPVEREVPWLAHTGRSTRA